MLLNLTEISTEPIHQQIARQIWEKILAGDLDAKAELPPARKLARNQHINLQTVERAYKELLKEGIINTNNQIDYFVSPLTEEQKQVIARHRLMVRNSPLGIIDTFSNQLSSVFDPEKIQAILEDSLLNQLNVKDIFFAFEKNNKVSLDSVKNRNDKVTFQPDDPVYQNIIEVNRPVNIKDISEVQSGSTLAKAIRSLGIQLVYALKDGDNVLGFIGLSDKVTGHPFLREDIGILTVLSNQFVTALNTARYYYESVQKRKLEEELSIARQIQQDLLPKSLPDNGTFSIAALSEPSLTVGGDFYDCIKLDESNYGLIIADASGKGLPAAMLISQIQAIIKSEVQQKNSLLLIMKNLNRHIKQYSPANNFATLFFGIYNTETQLLQYINAGHNYPVITGIDSDLQFLHTTGPALGITYDAQYSISEITLNKGETLILYTDGITETMDENNEEFGDERLFSLLKNKPELDPGAIIDLLLSDLDGYRASGTLHDDRTLLLMNIKDNQN